MSIFNALKHKDKKDKSDQKKNQKDLDSKKKKKEELTVADIQEGKKVKGKGKTKDKKSKVKADKHDTKEAHKVLIRVLITEKASYLKVENKYLFEVDKNTNKNEIKKAIYHVYGVWPIKVNISNLSGKSKRYGQNTGITKNKKKAIITLKDGDSIELYEGV